MEKEPEVAPQNVKLMPILKPSKVRVAVLKCGDRLL
jgi:hypothetical protein